MYVKQFQELLPCIMDSHSLLPDTQEESVALTSFDSLIRHFYLAAYHFHKMALKWAADDSAPLPLRTLSKPEDAIDYAKLGENGLSNDFVFYETQTNHRKFGFFNFASSFVIFPNLCCFFSSYYNRERHTTLNLRKGDGA